MPLKKLLFRPGINKEVTALSAAGGWVDCDRVRFRKGFPESIGGWQRYSLAFFLGAARTLIEWATLKGAALYGIGTNLKYYVSQGGEFTDITPIRRTTLSGAVTFSATNGSRTVTVSDIAHGALPDDFVTFSGAVSLGGVVTAAVLNREYQITSVPTLNAYTIQLAAPANASDTGNGGASVVGAYQLNTGDVVQEPLSAWSGGGWGAGAWGVGGVSAQQQPLWLWNHASYGEDLILGPRGGKLYYFDSSAGVSSANRATLIVGSDVPVVHNGLLVSDVSRFAIVFGCNELGSAIMDPMLVRWADQEDYTQWTPAITNQAGGQRLSNGSTILSYRQGRQEILIWTDTAMYSMQYVGPDAVWAFQLLGENTSVVSPQATTVTQGVAYWMGRDKFYKYDGRVQTLECDLRRFVFNDLNYSQAEQVVCGTNEGFNEIWWFYPTANSTTNNRYVIYNYQEGIWYHGAMSRTAWMDSRLRGNPMAAFGQTLLDHEIGVDDASSAAPVSLNAQLTSAPVDIDDGERFSLVTRVLPDITFDRSTGATPRVTMTVLPMKSSGQGYNDPLSVGGQSEGDTTRSATVPVEMYTSQVNIRARGRQLVLKIQAEDVGVAWQLGSPRVDITPSGRRG